MRLLLVVHDAALAGEVREELSARRDAVEVWSADSFEEARAWLERTDFDAMLVATGKKRLSAEAFLKRVAAMPTPPAVLLLGEAAPGTRRIEPGPVSRVLSQVFSALGHTRSALAETRAVESLGYALFVHFERVAWPGTPEPLIRVSASAGQFDASTLPLAQRVADLQGPGLAPTLECFWDDPNPHLLQAVGPGVTLWRLMSQRKAEGARGALAILRGVAEGVRTAHAAGISAGLLDPCSIWLGVDGSVSLLGVPFGQLAPSQRRGYGLLRESPPEEYATAIAPQVEGDAYRLGVLCMRLAVADDPLPDMEPLVHVRAEWAPDLAEHRPTLGASGPLIETLVQPLGVDRPRGEHLFELIAACAPEDWRAHAGAAAAWSLEQPYYVMV